MAMTTTRYDLARDELADLLSDEPSYRADQLWTGLYDNATALEDLTTLPKALRASLAETLPSALSVVTESVSDGGDTIKWLWALPDGATIETVLMHYDDRSTVCISTQAGCAMGCGFCATGQSGFERHLTVGEIVEQVIRAIRRARPRRVSNVVFMGMGEPLANYDRTVAAVRRIHADLGLSARHITVSTVGMVPGIRRLAAEGIPVSLAVSLHAGNDTLRDELVPINRRHPIAQLVEACREYRRSTGRRVSFEWAMIEGVNDSAVDADELAELAGEARAHVNLIPLNPTPGYPTVGTSAAGVRSFQERLRAAGVNTTVRANRGTDIDAACGQLRADHPITQTTEVAPPKRHPQGISTAD